MSATKRGSTTREAFDSYSSYKWCVDRLLEAADLPGGAWLEPCAGSGTIIEAVNAKRNDVAWAAVEIQPKYEAPLRALIPDPTHVAIADFTTLVIEPREYPPLFACSITNPPFTLAEAFIKKCQKLAGVTAMLLRVNFLESEDRAAWLREWTPDIYVLPNRPNFNPTMRNGKMSSGDSAAYAWFLWDWRRVSGRGSVQVLDVTPEDVRSAEMLPRKQAARAAVAQLGAPTTPASEDVTRPETPGAKAL